MSAWRIPKMSGPRLLLMEDEVLPDQCGVRSFGGSWQHWAPL